MSGSPPKTEIAESGSKTKKCAGKESFQRMNYLYQISNVMATESEATNTASTMYSNLLVAISKKSVQRLDVDMKRTICKGCRSLLLVGSSCKVRLKKKRLIWTCLKCQTVKAFNMKDKEYQVWTQRGESIVELLEY